MEIHFRVVKFKLISRLVTTRRNKKQTTKASITFDLASGNKQMDGLKRGSDQRDERTD